MKFRTLLFWAADIQLSSDPSWNSSLFIGNQSAAKKLRSDYELSIYDLAKYLEMNIIYNILSFKRPLY